VPRDARDATLAVLDGVLGDGDYGLAVRLWDGSTWGGGARAAATLVLREPGALRAMLGRGGERALAAAYVRGVFDVEGDLEAVFPAADAVLARGRPGLRTTLHVARLLRSLPPAAIPHAGRGPARLAGRRHTPARDRAAAGYAYDLPPAFFALFLDSRLSYSCAYYRTPGDDLESAQEQKLDVVCRKLRLEPGQRLLDLGCGWGGLALHASLRYGADVVGVTNSPAQAAYARAAVAAAGAGDRCRIVEADWRAVDGAGGFDRIASVAMLEHVGADGLEPYLRRLRRLLRPGGLALVHAIARAGGIRERSGAGFLQDWIFPDAELVPVPRVLAAAEAAGFEIRDVESLREHYVLTARAWRARLETRRAEAELLTDASTCRAFALYLAGGAHGFAVGRVSVFQTLLVARDGRPSALPLTRAHHDGGDVAGAVPDLPLRSAPSP
jgi:cyclopropane-fatty-acyl-phospholipid synthase